MKLKHSIWLLIGIFFTSVGDPLLVNGIDFIGWVVIFYTSYKIIISEEFKELFNY
jgi:hypothetical protein